MDLATLGKIAGIAGITIGAVVLIFRSLVEQGLSGMPARDRGRVVITIALCAFGHRCGRHRGVDFRQHARRHVHCDPRQRGTRRSRWPRRDYRGAAAGSHRERARCRIAVCGDASVGWCSHRDPGCPVARGGGRPRRDHRHSPGTASDTAVATLSR